MTATSIEWTDATWNPTRGCSRVSEGCRNCYAERIAARFAGRGGSFEGFASITRRQWSGHVALVKDKLAEPLHWRKPRRVFVNSMSDLFHEALPDVDIAKVLAVMVAAPWHTFQILTKRPERMRAWIDWSGRARHFVGAWPPKNVWLGVSVEDQATADERVPLLLQTPAAKRFVSYEPALGPVDFGRFLPAVVARGAATMSAETVAALKELARAAVKHVGWSTLDWIIVGAESGPRARPFNPDWARSVRDQCQAAGAPFFYKQDAIKGRKVPTPELDGRRWMEFPT